MNYVLVARFCNAIKIHFNSRTLIIGYDIISTCAAKVATENVLCQKHTYRKCTLTKMYTEIVLCRNCTTKMQSPKMLHFHHCLYALTENIPLSKIFNIVKKQPHHALTENVPLLKMYLLKKTKTPSSNRKRNLIKNV